MTNPRLWLIGQGVILLGLSLLLEEFELLPLDLDGYWMTLKEMEHTNLRGILSNSRAFGYPLFLKLVLLASPGMWLLPFFQVAVRVLCVYVFSGGLQRIEVRPWLAFLVSCPLLYTNLLFSGDSYLRATLVLPDPLGESLLILCVGLLFQVLSSPNRVSAWVAFTVALFLSYQVQPSYQILAAIFPLLGWPLLALVKRREDWLRLRWRVVTGLAAACLLPLLAWCTLRLVLVGHFGLALFTGRPLGSLADDARTWPFVWLLGPLGLLAVLWLLLFLFRPVRVGRQVRTVRMESCPPFLRELKLMLLVACSLFVVQVMLTGAMGRFWPQSYGSAEVFLPSVTVVGIAFLLGQIRLLLSSQAAAEGTSSLQQTGTEPMLIGKWLTNPRFWLIGQGIVLLGLSLVLEQFELLPLDMDGYWMTLKEMEYADLRGILSNVRPFGYPQFLKLVLLVSQGLWLLPFFQLAVRVLAVCVFYGGLRRLEVRPWLAFVIASPLFYACIIFSRDFCVRVTQVLTDPVGESLLILCVGLLFGVLSSPSKVGGWVLFAAALFLTYQVRPLYQFMVVLFPLLGWVILALVQPRAEWQRWRWRVGGGLGAACLVPFLAWCTFRLVMVGHFGLVSFTGNTLGGVAGQILTPEVLADLPAEHQEFAQAVLTRKESLIKGKLPRQFGPWKPAFDEDGRIMPGIVDDNPVYLFAQVDLFQTVSEQFHDYDYVAGDRKQLQVALAIFRARPWQYAQWCFQAWSGAPAKVLWYNVVLLWLLVPLGLLAAFLALLFLFRCVTDGPKAALARAVSGVPALRELKVMLLVAFSILLVQVLLIGAMVAFLPRYYDSAGVFLPSVVMVAMAVFLDRIRTLLFTPTSPA